jgi:hypothetical protein
MAEISKKQFRLIVFTAAGSIIAAKAANNLVEPILNGFAALPVCEKVIAVLFYVVANFLVVAIAFLILSFILGFLGKRML